MNNTYSAEELKEILYQEFFIITDTPQDGICYLREDGKFLYIPEELIVDYFGHLPTHGIEIDWLYEEKYISSRVDLFFEVVPDLNDGLYRPEESRISLSTIDKLTPQQYSSLKLWIEKVIYLDNRVDGLTVVTDKPFEGKVSYIRYSLYEPGTRIVRDDISAKYIINRIRRYFNTGQLLENTSKGETHMIEKQKEFNEVGATIAKHIPNVDAIELDVFTSGGYNYEYIVVTFKGGAISVRAAAGNSLVANISEVAKLLYGGYYREVERYQQLKKGSTTLKEGKAGRTEFTIDTNGTWKEDNKEQLTYQHLLDFATDLSRSQGSYGRIARDLRNMYDWEIEELNEQLIELGYRNDLMTIIDIFEG